MAQTTPDRPVQARVSRSTFIAGLCVGAAGLFLLAHLTNLVNAALWGENEAWSPAIWSAPVDTAFVIKVAIVAVSIVLSAVVSLLIARSRVEQKMIDDRIDTLIAEIDEIRHRKANKH